MEAGKLRFRIIIQSNHPARDDYGDNVPIWVDDTTRWGNIITLDGSEEWQAQYINALNTHMIVLRYIDSLIAAKRLVFKNRVFNIKSVLDVNERLKQTSVIVKEET